MASATRRSMRGSICRSAGSRTRRAASGGGLEAAREKMSKSELALDIVRRARARGIRFAWVGVDGGYGKEPDFLRRLDDENETFVADVHRNQHIWTKEPGLHFPASKP